MSKNIILKLKNLFLPNENNNFRPGFLQSRYLLYYMTLLLVLKLLTFPLLACLPKTNFFADISKGVLITLTNKDRVLQGLAPLTENSKLSDAAYLKAQDMLENDYFSHQSPEGVTPWYWIKKAGYDYHVAGENLAIGFLDSEEVFRAWMLSLPHQKNVLNPKYEEMGIAVLRGSFQGNDTTVVVLLFGSPALEKEIFPTAVAKTEEENYGVESSVLGQEEQKTTEEEKPSKELAAEELVFQEKYSREEFLSEITDGNKDKLSFKVFSFMNLHYYDFFEKVVYWSLILIIFSLIASIFVRTDVQCPDLIFKALCFILLLIFFLFLDKKTIIDLIPHGFSIY